MLYFFDGTTWRTALYFSGKHTDLLNKEVNGIIDHADNSITTEKLRDGAVTEAKLADNSVTEGKLAYGCVATENIQDGAVTEAKLADRAVGVDKINNPYKCRVIKTTTQSVPGGQTINIEWDTEDFDPSNMFDYPSTKTRFDIKKTGYYWIHCNILFAPSDTEQSRVYWIINFSDGTTAQGIILFFQSTSMQSHSFSVLRYLTQGSYFSVQIRNVRTDSVDVVRSYPTNNHETYLEVIMLA
jgi:hypothetical protein